MARLCRAALADAQERRIRLQAAKAELEKAGPKPICGNRGKPKPGNVLRGINASASSSNTPGD